MVVVIHTEIVASPIQALELVQTHGNRVNSSIKTLLYKEGVSPVWASVIIPTWYLPNHRAKCDVLRALPRTAQAAISLPSSLEEE